MAEQNRPEAQLSDAFSRTRLLVGEAGMEKLFRARVAVFGLGGVGGYTVEALSRSGIGALDLIDSDRISLSNLNRQILATWDTLGQYKVDAAQARILRINPQAKVIPHRVFYTPDTADRFDFTEYDYIVDAIDTVSGKLALIENAAKAHTPIISCMGAGNKMDASALTVADISETSVCPLARVMRKELKKRGIHSLKVVYSQEMPMTPDAPGETAEAASPRRQTPGSNAFVPAVAGLLLAGEVVRDLLRE